MLNLYTTSSVKTLVMHGFLVSDALNFGTSFFIFDIIRNT